MATVNAAAHNLKQPATSVGNLDNPNESKNVVAETSTGLPPLVMQIIVRRDLLNEEGWGYGPLMAQTAHAATAVLHETREREETIQYLAELRNMHKAVLETADVTSLLKLSSLLSSEASPGCSVIPHHLWIEHPENVPTCIAIAPNRKGNKIIRKALDKCKCRLWKD